MCKREAVNLNYHNMIKVLENPKSQHRKDLNKNTNARFHQPTSQPNQRSTVSIAQFSVVEILLNPDRIAEVML